MLRTARLIFSVVFSVGALAVAVPSRAYTQDADSQFATVDPVGHAAPPWAVRGWVNAQTLNVGDFRGHVVLLRFLTDSAESSQALIRLDEQYRGKGLAVIGMYLP